MKCEKEDQKTIEKAKLNTAIDYMLNLPVPSRARERVAHRKREQEASNGETDGRESSI